MVEVYRGDNFSVRKNMVSKMGRRIEYEEVVEPDVAVILPFLDKNTILLEKNFRPVLGRFIYELPAGHLNKGEKPSDAAKRELLEETGYAARKVMLAFVSFQTPGKSRSRYYHFVARSLIMKKQSLDADEIIDVEKVKFDTAMRMVERNVIKDEKSIAFLEYYQNHFR